MPYRSEHTGALARADALAAELAETQRELAESRRAVDAVLDREREHAFHQGAHASAAGHLLVVCLVVALTSMTTTSLIFLSLALAHWLVMFLATAGGTRRRTGRRPGVRAAGRLRRPSR